MLSQQTRRAGKRAPRRLEARVEARARDRAPQTARPVQYVICTILCLQYLNVTFIILSTVYIQCRIYHGFVIMVVYNKITSIILGNTVQMSLQTYSFHQHLNFCD